MDVIAYVWVGLGLVGTIFASLVLREVLADCRAAQLGHASAPARAYLKETLRSTWFQLAALAALMAAGVLPAAIPLGQRPGWVRYAAIWALIAGEALLVVNMALAWRAKRRYLAQSSQRNGGAD